MLNNMPRTSKKLSKSKTPKEYEELGRALQGILDSDFVDRRRAIKNRFILGLATGAGSILGATLLIALLLWLLSAFRETPLIGPVINNIRETVQEDRPR